MSIKKGDKVRVEYSGKLNDGTIFDKSGVENPLEFVVSSGDVIPGFDRAVEGMKLNEEKTVTIKSEDAYGSRKDELILNFQKGALPLEIEPEKGVVLALKTQTGESIPATIIDVKDDSITVDANHPLAGEDLIFEIKVVGVG